MGIGISLLLSFFYFFPLECNCFTNLCSFLLCYGVSQLCVCVCVCTKPPSWISLPPPPTSSHLSRSSQSIYLSSLCYIAAPFQLSILYIVVYMCLFYSFNISHPPLFCPCPPVHSLHLCLYPCPANKFKCTIFRDSIYMH